MKTRIRLNDDYIHLDSNIILTLKSVNSPIILNKIREFLEEGFSTLSGSWDNEDYKDFFVEIATEFLNDLQTQGLLTNSQIICDNRNNKQTDKINKIYHFEAQYQQKNCLNTTRLIYTFSPLKRVKHV